MDKGGYSPLGHKELDATEQRTAAQHIGFADINEEGPGRGSQRHKGRKHGWSLRDLWERR